MNLDLDAMTPKQRWQAIQDIFEAALEHAAADRDAFVEVTCKGDETLRREVLSLLVAFDESEDIDAQAQAWLASVSEPLEMPSLEGRRIGAYRVLRELGTGGMGAVYLAERADGQFEHQVALKLLRRGLGAEELRRRFLHERQILAQLLHPHIARLYDGGITDDGQPYFVMEHVDGQPIDQYCDTQQLGISDRLTLFMDVCRAVAYAHRNLVVHRDLKPSNIFVTGDGAAKLLDFGIAKLLEGKDESMETRTGLRVMTPEYAAPEQVRGEAITTATDVYTLGVVLYELLAGRRPYDIKGLPPSDVERVICNEDVEKPSTVVSRITHGQGAEAEKEAITPASISQARGTAVDKLRRRLAGDLDTVVLKAMHKEPERRYASAEELREDLERHLTGLPVRARSDTWGYRAHTFIRRHRVGVAAAVLVIGALLAGLAGTIWQARRATAQARLASNEAAKAQQVSGFLIDVFRVSDPSEALGDTITAREILDKGATQIEQELTDQPEVQATMMHVMGRVYQNLGLYEAARPLLEQALALRYAVLDEHHPDIAQSLSSLGRLRFDIGDVPAADSLYSKALALRRALYPEGHADLAAVLHALAIVRRQTGALDEAEALYREALAIRRALHGDQHPEMVMTLYNLASVLHIKGDFDGAEHLFRDVVASYQSLPGESLQPEALRIMKSLAELRRIRGDLEEAEPLLRAVLARRRQLYGPEHPDVIGDMQTIAELHLNKGRYQEAEVLYQEVLEITQKAFGEEYPDLWNIVGSLAVTRYALGRYTEAEPHLREAYVRRVKIYGRDHAPNVIRLIQWARCLRAMGRFEDAEARFRDALAAGQRIYGEEHPYVALSLRGLARVAHAQGHYVAADSLHRADLIMSQKLLRPGHRQISEGQYRLADLLRDTGDYEAADSLYREAVEGLRRALPERHPALVPALVGWGQLLTIQKQPEQAEVLLKEALELWQAALPADHWEVADAKSALGACLTALERYEEAEALLLQSYPVLKEKRGAQDRHTQYALARLVALYDAWGKPAEAVRYRALLAEAASQDAVET